MLDLYANLVESQHFTFLLTGLLTQDSLENMFSQLKGFGDSHPVPVHLRYNLLLLCLAQFMQIPKHSSYEPDEDVYMLNLIKCRTKNSSEPSNNVDSLASKNEESEGSLNVSGLVLMKNIAHRFVWWLGLDFEIEITAKNCRDCMQIRNVPPMTMHQQGCQPPMEKNLDIIEVDQ